MPGTESTLDSRDIPGLQTESPSSPWAWVLIALFLAAAVVMCSVQYSLIADGAFQLDKLIQDKRVFLIHGREFGDLLRSLPPLIAVRVGVDDTKTLATLQSVGFILFPAVIWCGAVFASRRDSARLVLVSIAGATCFATTVTFSATHLVQAMPLVALVSTLLAQQRALSWWGSGAAIAACVILVASHEGVAISAVLLAVQAVLRARSGKNRADRWGSWAVLVLSLAMVAWPVIIWFVDPKVDNGFASNLIKLEPRFMVAFLLAGICVAIWTLVARSRMTVILLSPLLLVAAAATAFGIRQATGFGQVHLAYDARSLSLVVLLLMQVALTCLWFSRARGDAGSTEQRDFATWRPAATVILAAALLAIPLIGAISWKQAVDQFRTKMATTHGLIPETSIAPEARRWLWGFGGSSLSVLLRGSPDDGVIEEPCRTPQECSEIARAAQLPPNYTWRW